MHKLRTSMILRYLALMLALCLSPAFAALAESEAGLPPAQRMQIELTRTGDEYQLNQTPVPEGSAAAILDGSVAVRALTEAQQQALKQYAGAENTLFDPGLGSIPSALLLNSSDLSALLIGASADVSIAENASLDLVLVDAPGAALNVAGTVNRMITAGDGADAKITLTGSGRVGSVEGLDQAGVAHMHSFETAAYEWSGGKGQKTCAAVKKCACGQTIDVMADVTMEKNKASCTKPGAYVFTAVFADPALQTQTAQEEIPALGHDWGPWEVTVPATCTEAGRETIACERWGCDRIETRSVAALGHDWEDTLTQGETTHYFACTRCDARKDEEPHTGDTVCPVCGMVSGGSDGDVPSVGMVDVSYDAIVQYSTKLWLYSWPATRIGTVKSGTVVHVTIEAGDMAYVWADFPCPLDGWISRAALAYSCAFHEWDEWTQTKAPTCSAPGEETRTCLNPECGATETRALDKLPHTPVDMPAVEPTTCTDGMTAGVRCGVCGEILSGCEPIPGLGHEPQDVLSVSPTCTDAGRMYGTICAVCGEILSGCETIPATGHAWQITYSLVGCEASVIMKRVPCTVQGVARCLQCRAKVTENAEGVFMEDAKSGNILHKMGATILVRAAFEQYPLGDGEEESLNVSLPSEHQRYIRDERVEPTCTQPGRTEKVTCWVCQQTLQEPAEIPTLGHDWGEGTQTKAPTCTETGEGTHVCTRCDTVETYIIPALDHDWGEWTQLQAPSCTEPGRKTRSCQRDDCVAAEYQSITFLGHSFVNGACERCGALESSSSENGGGGDVPVPVPVDPSQETRPEEQPESGE